MEIKEEKTDKYYVLSLSGRLDASTAPPFEEKLTSVIDDGNESVLVDFTDLEYISSSGLRVLLVGAKKLKQSSAMLNLCGLKSHIKEVFDIAGFTPLFKMYDSYDEAIN